MYVQTLWPNSKSSLVKILLRCPLPIILLESCFHHRVCLQDMPTRQACISMFGSKKETTMVPFFFKARSALSKSRGDSQSGAKSNSRCWLGLGGQHEWREHVLWICGSGWSGRSLSGQDIHGQRRQATSPPSTALCRSCTDALGCWAWTSRPAFGGLALMVRSRLTPRRPSEWRSINNPETAKMEWLESERLAGSLTTKSWLSAICDEMR